MSEHALPFYVEREGVRLHARDEGPRDAPLVVMVHGYPDDLTVWDGVVALLRDRFRILRYDVRGAGLSDTPKPVAAYALEELKADLFAVVDRVAPGAAFHIVGRGRRESIRFRLPTVNQDPVQLFWREFVAVGFTPDLIE